MAIIVQEKEKLFTLQTKNSTWQMQVSPYGHLLHLYYGKKVERTSMAYLIKGINRGFSGSPYLAFGKDRGYSLDTYPQEYPAFGTGDYRLSCLHLEHADGSQAVELVYVSHRVLPGKYSLLGLPALWDETGNATEKVQTLEIVLKDTASAVEVTLYYGVFEEYDAITRACRIRNGGVGTVYLNQALSACLDFFRDDWEMLSFYGRHTMERMVQRRSIAHGRLSVDSVRGSSSHQQNPFVVLCTPGANEEYGECFGVGFVYSGNFTAAAEVDQLNQTRFVMGIHPEGFRFMLSPGESFTAPEMVNEDSNLCRTHPDWCMKIPGRLPNVERGQLVLDMSREEVREYLFTEISAVLKEGEIDYVKWDMNQCH